MIDIVTTQTCLNCRFWDAWPDAQVGYCRRYAPKPLPLVLVLDDDGSDRAEAMWPITDADEWCGEFEKDGIDVKTCE